MSDMRGFVRVNTGVLYENFVFAPGDLRLTREHLPHKFSSIEPGVDVPGTCNFKQPEAWHDSQSCDHFFSGLARWLAQSLRQLECKWQRKLAKRNLRGLLNHDVRGVKLIGREQIRTHAFRQY